MKILSLISIVLNGACCWFQIKFMDKIVLFFTNLQVVKGYNQIINLIKIEEDKIIKKFIKKGENWY